MKRDVVRFFIFFTAVALTTVGVANADVISRDWKTPGDGLLTFDDVNQREWLDLSVSLLNQFPEPRLTNGVAQIGPGGLFEGFTWGRTDGVRALAESAGIITATWDFSTNEAATRHLIDLLGITLNSPPFVRSLGFIDPTDFAVPTPPRAGADFFVSFNQMTGQGGIAGLLISSTDDFFTPPDNFNIVGLMLFRIVPEPSALMLAILCLSGVGFVSRMRIDRWV